MTRFAYVWGLAVVMSVLAFGCGPTPDSTASPTTPATKKDAAPPVEEKLFDEKAYPTAILGKWKFVSGEKAFEVFSGETEFTKAGKLLQFDDATGKWLEKGTYRFVKNDLVFRSHSNPKNGSPPIDHYYRLTSISETQLVADSPGGKLERQK